MLRGDSCFLLLAIVPSPDLDNGGSLEAVGISAIVGVSATNILVSFSLCRLILQCPMTDRRNEERSSHGGYRVDYNEYLVVGKMAIDWKKINQNITSLIYLLCSSRPVSLYSQLEGATGIVRIMFSVVPSSWTNSAKANFIICLPRPINNLRMS